MKADSQRQPVWYGALGPQVEPSQVVDAFRKALETRLIPVRDLAVGVGVSPSTVTRWGQGKLEPSVGQMRHVLAALEAEAEAAMDRVGAAREAVELVAELEEKHASLTGAVTRGDQVKSLYRWRDAQARLAEVLEEMAD